MLSKISRGFGGLSCQLNCFTGAPGNSLRAKDSSGSASRLGAKFKGQQGLWHFGYEKTTILKFGPNSSLALTLTMRNGSWEAPKGDSGPRSSEPIVESIELSGPGNRRMWQWRNELLRLHRIYLQLRPVRDTGLHGAESMRRGHLFCIIRWI
ncbi:MAG: hypothetical protein JKY56_15170 [Kofleriaceae bacterium]|nr:hypothetical protein [Kofleriaceae bacterium]